MQWILLNAIGASAWLAGLTVAKGVSVPFAGSLAAGDHHLVIGMAFSLVGLALLLWGNFRSPA